MRVLRISHSAAVDEWRGRERALRDLGVHVELLSAPSEDAGGATLTLAARPGERVTGVRRVGSHPALFVYDPRPIWRALGQRWDVLDIHEEPFALATAEILLLRALRRNRAPIVLYTAQNLRKRYPIPFRWLERYALRSAAGISACNSAAARIAEEKGFSGRARTIPLGVDPSQFNPVSSNPHAATDYPLAPGWRAETIVAGYLGRLVPEKGVGVLLDAAALDPRIRVRVAGDGPSLDAFRSQASELGITDRVDFLGALPPVHVPAFYRGLDVVAIPSLPTPGWTEQFGRVAVEAMACGIPVVSSDAGALPDVVGGAGLVVPHGNASALARAIADAAGQQSDELRSRGFARVEQCTWEAVGLEYLDLYRTVRHEPSAPEPDLEIVVVAFGRPDLVHEALLPLTGLPITVVDNSSRSDIATLCGELGVRYLDPGSNRGFAAGVNVALKDRLRPGADVLLLNPDARISREALAELHHSLRARRDVASVAPSQVDEIGKRAQVSWPFPSPGNAWLEALGLARARRGATFAIGSVLLLRSEALAQLGGLDERFFLYAEETDWSYRGHLRGWRHAEVESVQALHHGAGTSTDERRREVHFHASQERYYRKHFGALGWQSARTAVWAGSMARACVLPGERRREARRRAAIYHIGPIRVESRLASQGALA